MNQEICNCHLNNFTHWKFVPLREKYDLGIKAHFDRITGEPRLILYVSVTQISGQVYIDLRSLPVVLTRTVWSQRRGISAVEATEELQRAVRDLDSQAVRFLISIADEEIPKRLRVFENTADLDRSEILA